MIQRLWDNRATILKSIAKYQLAYALGWFSACGFIGLLVGLGRLH